VSSFYSPIFGADKLTLYVIICTIGNRGENMKLNSLPNKKEYDDESEYWYELSKWYVMEQTWYLSTEEILNLFHGASKDDLMDDEDFIMYNTLPEQITVYRGAEKDSEPKPSWTNSFECAKQFAKQYKKNGIVYKAKIDKNKIIAAFYDPKEPEILLDPKQLRNIKTIEDVIICCPWCGSNNVAEILYGLPAMDENLRKDIDEGRIYIGGCVVSDYSPQYHCNNCKKEFYHYSGSMDDYD